MTRILSPRFVSVLALAPVLIASAMAATVDWPQWRGPDRNAISTEKGLLQEWPKDGPKLLWKATGLGAGYSSVALVGDRIFTTGDLGDANFVIALNRTDGKPVWSTKLGKTGAPGWGNFAGPRATPTVVGGSLFVVDQWGEMVCLEAASGKELWRKNFVKDLGGDRPEWGFSESPLVDGDKVIVTPGGSKGAIVALNTKSGEVLWRTADFTDPAHYSSLIIAEIGKVRQYVQLTSSHVVGVSTAGQVLWKAPRKGRTAVIPTPVCLGDHVYITSGYGDGCNLFKITAKDGAFSAEEVYANKAIVNHHGGVIELGGFIYGHSDSKGWTCQDMKSGAVKWQVKDQLGKGSIVYADGRFILRQEDKKGTVALIEATTEGYREHGRFDQPERSSKNSWPHPVVADGKLYLRDQDLLLCYDLRK